MESDKNTWAGAAGVGEGETEWLGVLVEPKERVGVVLARGLRVAEMLGVDVGVTLGVGISEGGNGGSTTERNAVPGSAVATTYPPLLVFDDVSYL